MNLKLPHWAQLVLAFAVVAVTWVMNEQANGALVLPAIAVSVLTLVKTVLGLVSDSVSSSKTPPSTGAGSAGAVVAAALMALVVGCSLFHTIEPAAVDCATRVLDDAAKNMSVAQIVDDVAAPCGMDMAAVIAILATSKDTRVQGTPAQKEAMHVKAALEATP